MAKYVVNYAAIYEVIIQVEAENKVEAARLAQEGHGEFVEQLYDRPHPETEVFVDEI